MKSTSSNVVSLGLPAKTWMGEPVLPELVRHLVSMSAELQLRLSEYFASQRVPISRVLRVDLAVALLRIDTAEARMHAQELTGCAVQKCPSGLPPWPPRPVTHRHKPVKVKLLVVNPCRVGTDAHRRYGMLRVGMTQDQLRARGITQRDVEHWTKKNWLRMGQ